MSRPGIGHNGPPAPPGRGFHRYAWARSKARLIPPAPIEVVRRRMRRAAALGLSYPTYATAVAVAGRDLQALMLTSAAATERGPREAMLRSGITAKVAEVRACDLLLLRTLRAEKEALLPLPGALPVRAEGSVGKVPARAPLPPGRDAIRRLLAEERLPPTAVAMIGVHALERAWADAASLSRFWAVEDWLAEVPAQPA